MTNDSKRPTKMYKIDTSIIVLANSIKIMYFYLLLVLQVPKLKEFFLTIL